MDERKHPRERRLDLLKHFYEEQLGSKSNQRFLSITPGSLSTATYLDYKYLEDKNLINIVHNTGHWSCCITAYGMDFIESEQTDLSTI